MTADGKEYGFSKNETLSEFREILSALTKAGEVDLVIRYDYCWRASWQMYDLMGPFHLMDFMKDPEDYDTSGIFYSAWNKADSDEGPGELVAYGEHNGKTYSGQVEYTQVSSIPEGNWYEINTPVIIDTDESFDAKAYPDLLKVCQKLAEMAEDPRLDYEDGLSFFLNNVNLTTNDQQKRYCELVRQLVDLAPDDLEFLIDGGFVDASKDDARLMTIEHDGQDLVIKVAEIL